MYTSSQPWTASSSVETLEPAAGGLLDHSLLKAARYIYRTYYEVHPEDLQRPIGIAINRLNHRGKLIFGNKPVLLPQESFIPLNILEPELH